MASTTCSMARSQQQIAEIPAQTAGRQSSQASRGRSSRKRRKRRLKTAGKHTNIKSFLDLPFELRHQIYQYVLLGFPSKKRMTVSKREAIATTKRSLLLICHQVSAEYGPLFYCQVRIMVHAKYLRETPAWRRRRCDPTDFDNLYLKTLAEYKLRNIRKLTYNATLVNTPYSLPEICTSTTWIDWSGLSRLSGVLCKYPGILESLEELKIYVEPHEFLPEEEEDFDDDLDVGSVWYFAPEAGPWHKMEDQLVHDGGPLQGWRISRSVRLKVHRRPRRRRGTDDHKNIVVSCASEFRKVSTPKSVDEDEDVNADTSTYPITLDFEYY